MLRHFFKKLANLKFAIIILLLIALTSSIGSIIEQNKDISYYENQYFNLVFGVPYWKILLFLGLNDIYGTWWFLCLLFTLALSLTCCTILQQLPTLKFSRRYYFYKQINQFKKLSCNIEGFKVFQSHLGYTLVTKEYSFFQQYNCIYAYKGLISRVGPIVVHLSILCVLLGSTLGALNGFNSQELIPKTEIFHVQNIIKNGFLSSISQQAFRINDFWSTYTNNGSIKQFYSDISVLNGNGSEFRRKTISVNNPLLIKDIIVYQTDWGILGLRLKVLNTDVSNYTLQLPISKINTNTNQKLWISWLPNTIKHRKSFIILIKNIRGQITLYNKEGKFIKNTNLGEKIFITELLSLSFIDIILSTGIQIKSDPGIKLIYFGFLVLIISSLVSYISFSEFWLLSLYEKVISGGKTNRAKVKFNIEFLKFKQSFIQ